MVLCFCVKFEVSFPSKLAQNAGNRVSEVLDFKNFQRRTPRTPHLIDALSARIASAWEDSHNERTVSSSFVAPAPPWSFIFSKIDISTEWLGTFKSFFQSVSSLTYNRLSKAIWSFAPFRLSSKSLHYRGSKLELGAISFQQNWYFYRMVQYIEFFFESLSSLTYNRLNKAIWSFISFRLSFVYPAKVYTIAAHPPPPGRITNLCIKIVHLETFLDKEVNGRSGENYEFPSEICAWRNDIFDLELLKICSKTIKT